MEEARCSQQESLNREWNGAGARGMERERDGRGHLVGEAPLLRLHPPLLRLLPPLLLSPRGGGAEEGEARMRGWGSGRGQPPSAPPPALPRSPQRARGRSGAKAGCGGGRQRR
eukprot:268424-Rhodomonas_salina.1